ncbi:hypothetical protein C7Y45_14005 [Brevibacillus brevis]|nr:hypothetical protein C7Y45_14005 [Lysinibacillus sp. SDF0063]
MLKNRLGNSMTVRYVNALSSIRCSGEKSCHMFSSRLFPLCVRAVSFRTCDRTSNSCVSEPMLLHHCESMTRSFLNLLTRCLIKSRVGRSAFPVQAPLEPYPAKK